VKVNDIILVLNKNSQVIT